MGWDVVEIGIKHDLPVEDPWATAEVLSKRMNRNLRLVATERFKYDSAVNSISEGSYDLFELGRFKVNESEEFLNFHVCNYQAKHLFKTLGEQNLRSLTFSNKEVHHSFNFYKDYEFELYEFDSDDNNEDLNLRILRENVDLDVYVTSRYSGWQRDLLQCQTSKEVFDRIQNYRLEIYKRARICGCTNVIICSDQGPTEAIFNIMDATSHEILDYTQSKKYIQDYNEAENPSSEEDKWDEETSIHLDFPAFMRGEQKLSEEDFVTVIFDDFSDIEKI